jgi:hypothetical protein
MRSSEFCSNIKRTNGGVCYHNQMDWGARGARIIIEGRDANQIKEGKS